MVKLFISHASEDKTAIAEPLAVALKSHFDVWIDIEKLTAGDSLRRGIARGLANADFGVVILSPDFLRKYWTQSELGALTAMETSERKVIIPICWQATIEDIRKVDPLLADRIIIDGSQPLSKIVDEIRIATGAATRAIEIERLPAVAKRLKELEARIAGQKVAENLSHTEEGTQKVLSAARTMLDEIEQFLSPQDASSNQRHFHCERKSERNLTIRCPERISCALEYRHEYGNSLAGAYFKVEVVKYAQFSSRQIDWTFLDELRLPKFDGNGEVCWREQHDHKDVLSCAEFRDRILNAVFDSIKEIQDNAD